MRILRKRDLRKRLAQGAAFMLPPILAMLTAAPAHSMGYWGSGAGPGGTLPAWGSSGNLLTSSGSAWASSAPSFNASAITAGLLTNSHGGTGVDTSAAANGTLLIGNGTGLTLASLTSSGATVAITPGAGSINLEVASPGMTNPMTTPGDLITGGTAGAPQRLGIGSNGTFLQPASGSVGYSAYQLPLTVGSSGKVFVSNGTNIVSSTPTLPITSSPAANKVLVGDGTNVVLATPTMPLTSSPASGKILIGDGTNWIASTPTFPGTASAANGKLIQSDGTNWVATASTFPTASAATGDLYVGTGTGTMGVLSMGTANQVLSVNGAGTNIGWSAAASGMTNPMTNTGDMIYSSSGSTPARLAIGTSGTILRAGSSIPAWTSATYPLSATKGDLIYGSATNAWSNLAIGSQGKILQAGSSTPGYTPYTMPTASPTSGNELFSDGTNLVAVTYSGLNNAYTPSGAFTTSRQLVLQGTADTIQTGIGLGSVTQSGSTFTRDNLSSLGQYVTMTSGSTNGNVAKVTTSTCTFARDRVGFFVHVNGTNTTTTNVRIHVGLYDDETQYTGTGTPASGHYCMGFRFDTSDGDTNWMYEYQSGGSYAASSTGILFNSTEWLLAYIYDSANQTIDFYVNGAHVGSQVTSFAPTASNTLKFAATVTTLTNAARSFDVGGLELQTTQ